MSKEPSLNTGMKQKEKPLIIRAITWFGFLIVLLVCIFMIFGYLDNRSQEESPLPPPITVRVSTLEKGSLSPTFEFIGSIRARQLAQVAPEVNAVRILSTQSDVGDKVKAGDVLAIFDDKSLNYQKSQAQSAYDQALDEYNRKNRLGINGGISQEELTAKRLAVSAAKARLDDAILLLSKSQLTSPVDGVIISKNKEVGTLTNINEAIFTIAVNQETEFVANIPENQLFLFAPEQNVEISLSGHKNLFQGTIRRIEPSINDTSRTANIYIQFKEPMFHPIGLFGTARISLPIQEGIIAPATAILLDENGQYLWYVNNNNRVAKLYINEVIREDNLAIIEINQTLNEINNINKIESLNQLNILLKAGSLVNEGDIVTPQITKTALEPNKTKG